MSETLKPGKSFVRARRFDGVFFDMDGTLIEPLLDFAAIRAELGIASNDGLIEAIAGMPQPQAHWCSRRLLEHELGAARRANLMPGAMEVLRTVAQAGLKAALLTRNAQEAMEIVLRRFSLRFNLAWSRQMGPIKPQPDAVLRACRELKIAPARTVCVGDFVHDITAAKAAGAVSVLLIHAARPAFADQADHVITKLPELLGILGIA
jgi:HAD superfamily hydrolase (TIGR01509 family)